MDRLLTLVREMADQTLNSRDEEEPHVHMAVGDSQKRLGARRATLQHNRIELSPSADSQVLPPVVTRDKTQLTMHQVLTRKLKSLQDKLNHVEPPPLLSNQKVKEHI